MSQALRDARKYEEIERGKISEEMRPVFHLTPMVGWMNDPNGFSYYKGEYHMFYQYHPYDAFWGPMHWGHAVSKDLLRWDYKPAALAPDTDYDKDGCFSGSAITLPDGRQLLMYTSVLHKVRPDGSGYDIQTQSLAVGDGTDYEKYEMNPVLTQEDLPEDGNPEDFRDPKMWRTEDGVYRCAIACGLPEKNGHILLYRSEDGFHWDYDKVLAANDYRYGRMWECPDFFELDGKQVILTSPQDMLPENLEYRNGNGTLCLIGSYDQESRDFTEERNQSIDYGIDFYAPQTVLTEDGRRIMIGWMQNWDTCMQHDRHRPWFGQMSIPRELSIRDGKLIQKPIRELDSCRCNKVEYHDVPVSEVVSLAGVEGRVVDLELTVKPADKENFYRNFVVNFAQKEGVKTTLSFRPHEKVLKLDRTCSGSRRAILHQTRCKVESFEEELKLRIIIDKFSAEVFAADGEKVMSVTIYSDQDAKGISFLSDGEALVNVVKYDLIRKD